MKLVIYNKENSQPVGQRNGERTLRFNREISTFPQDYNFCGLSPHYICGMSVPPVMMAQIATRIYEQWLSKL